MNCGLSWEKGGGGGFLFSEISCCYYLLQGYVIIEKGFLKTVGCSMPVLLGSDLLCSLCALLGRCKFFLGEVPWTFTIHHHQALVEFFEFVLQYSNHLS